MAKLSFNWRRIDSCDERPGVRSRHGLVFDNSAKTLVLFGGVVYKRSKWGGTSWHFPKDTWEFCGKRWTEIKTSRNPPPRHRGAMVYDSSQGYSVLFGGQSAQNQILSDTWIYSNGNWTKCAKWFFQRPSPRCGHAMAFDESMGATVMFGGISQFQQSLGDTWIFENGSWKRLRCAGPSRRRYAALAYHPELKGCVLHGGALDDVGQTKYGDTWLFQNGEWTQFDNFPETDEIDDHGLIFDQSLNRMIMVGGLRSYGDPQIFVMSKSGWRPVETEMEFPHYQCSQLAYDSTLRGIVPHGGEAGHGGTQLNQTFLLSITM